MEPFLISDAELVEERVEGRGFICLIGGVVGALLQQREIGEAEPKPGERAGGDAVSRPAE